MPNAHELRARLQKAQAAEAGRMTITEILDGVDVVLAAWTRMIEGIQAELARREARRDSGRNDDA